MHLGATAQTCNPNLWELRQKDCYRSRASLGHTALARPCLKNNEIVVGNSLE